MRKRVHLKLRSLRARKGERFLPRHAAHSIPIICQGQDHPSKDSQPSKAQTPQDGSRLPAIMGIGWFLNVAIMLSSSTDSLGFGLFWMSTLWYWCRLLDIDIEVSYSRSDQTTRGNKTRLTMRDANLLVYICKNKSWATCSLETKLSRNLCALGRYLEAKYETSGSFNRL
jgi:hypothetical protein